MPKPEDPPFLSEEIQYQLLSQEYTSQVIAHAGYILALVFTFATLLAAFMAAAYSPQYPTRPAIAISILLGLASYPTYRFYRRLQYFLMLLGIDQCISGTAGEGPYRLYQRCILIVQFELPQTLDETGTSVGRARPAIVQYVLSDFAYQVLEGHKNSRFQNSKAVSISNNGYLYPLWKHAKKQVLQEICRFCGSYTKDSPRECRSCHQKNPL